MFPFDIPGRKKKKHCWTLSQLFRVCKEEKFRLECFVSWNWRKKTGEENEKVESVLRYLMQRRKKIEILSRMFRFVRRFYNERKRTKKGEALVLHCWISDIYAKKRIGDFISNVSCNDARGMERKEENGREERWEKKNRYIWCKREKENRGFLFRLAEGRKQK